MLRPPIGRGRPTPLRALAQPIRHRRPLGVRELVPCLATKRLDAEGGERQEDREPREAGERVDRPRDEQQEHESGACTDR